MLRDELGAAEPAERAELDAVQMPEPRPLAGGGSQARSPADSSRPTMRTASFAPAARATRTWCGRASGELEAAPDAVVLPGSNARRSPPCSRRVRRRGSRSSRSAAAPASSAASIRTRAARRRDLARPRRAFATARSTTARSRPALGPRPARPRGRGRAGGARPDARALPAVVRVRDDRRLRRDALGRAGVGGLRAVRRARDRGRDGHPGRARCATLETPHTAAGPGAARARRRLRGHARA